MMDRLDKINIVILVGLLLITAGMVTQHEITAKKQDRPESDAGLVLKKQYEKKIAENAETYKEVINLQKLGHYAEALTKLEEIIQSHPEKAQAYIYKAQLLNSQGNLVESIKMYRAAIEMEPDFVDKKSPLFVGNTVLKLIPEARSKLNREKKLKPGDKMITAALDNIYYLQRRIAGGCE